MGKGLNIRWRIFSAKFTNHHHQSKIKCPAVLHHCLTCALPEVEECHLAFLCSTVSELAWCGSHWPVPHQVLKGEHCCAVHLLTSFTCNLLWGLSREAYRKQEWASWRKFIWRDGTSRLHMKVKINLLGHKCHPCPHNHQNPYKSIHSKV